MIISFQEETTYRKVDTCSGSDNLRNTGTDKALFLQMYFFLSQQIEINIHYNKHFL